MKRQFITILSLATAVVIPFAAVAQSSAIALAKAQKAIAAARTAVAPDARQNLFDIKAFADSEGNLIVGGRASEVFIKAAVTDSLAKEGIDYIDSIVVIPFEWAQTRIPAASHRTRGSHAAEMSTQSVMGTPLRVLAKDGEFWQVQTPDGYIAFVPSSSVVLKSDEEMKVWRNGPRFVVTSIYPVRAYRDARAKGPRDVVTDLVNGSIVTLAAGDEAITEGRMHIELPDGRTGYADASAFSPIELWAAQSFDPDRILDMAYSIEGTPYLWGGTSSKALDCSGLAKVSYLSNGIILMRDASQQALTGTRIDAEDWRICQPGDLLFFGNKDTGKVTHVAIYDHDGKYVHSSGRVKRNSIDPESPDYLTTYFLHAVRIAGNEDTPGITSVRNHPWFFDK